MNRIAKFYNIPHIKIKDIAKECKNLEGELGDEIREKLEEMRNQLQEDYDNMSKKEKRLYDVDELEPKVPEEYIYKAIKIMLNSNACRNRGYVLDNFPLSYPQAQKIFLSKTFFLIKFVERPKSEDDEEEPAEEDEPNYEEYILDQDIAPSSIILFTGNTMKREFKSFSRL